VKDTKKEKRIARVERKKQAELEASKSADESADDGISSPAPKNKKKKEKGGDDDGPVKKVKGASQPPKKKKLPTKAADVKKPNSASDLVKLITDILENTPQRYQHTPAIGDRIQALTKLAWNKTFKPQFGSLKDFLSSQSAFHVDEALDRVYLQSDFIKVAAERTASAAQTAAKKAKKVAKKVAHTVRSSSENGDAEVADATEVTSTVVKYGVLIAVVVAVIGVGGVLASGGDLKSFGL